MNNSFSTQESQIVRRQSSLGGNNIKRTVTELEGNTALVWAKVTQVYYQKGTCDFTLLGGNTLLNDNSGSNGTYSAPIPVDYYGTNYQGKPFIKTRLVKEGNKVLVAFVDGKLANPVIVGVYPDNTEGYEYLAPAYTNKILDENEDTNNQVNNMLEVEPSNQIIYQSGNGDFAKSMQGKSFLIVQGSEQYALNDLLTNYDSLPYFYLDEESNDINSQKVPLYSVNEDAPEWLLVHESNNGTDTHRTRFYVNKKGELQIVFFDVNNPSELLVIDGSKDNGFTVNKRFDGDGNLDSDSKDYVKFNVGQDHKISMEVSSAKESKAQSQKLELKDDGLYYNGKSLLSYLDNIDSSVNDDDVKDIINSTTGVDNWDDFRDKVHQAAQDAQKAADEAKEAGDDADRAGEEAAQAGLDAKLAGENAAAKVDSMRDKLMYYLNLSPEKDLYVPGKYLILNEDVTIRSGFIKEGYIDDAAINSAAIKNAAITSAKIKDLAVYSAKIANAAITNAKISKLAVGTAQIRDLAVTDEKVGKLTFNHMIGEVLDANLIKVTNLEADSIKAHSITADKLFVGSLGEISGNLGNITGGHIDGSKVDIDGLPSDDPDMLTPEKKAQLRATVDTLQLAVNAQVDFQNSVGAPSNVCDTLKTNMAKLVSDTTPLLRDMFSTEPYDHNLINTDIDNVNIELNNIQHRAITTIGKTANGKNTIYTCAFAPSNPQLGDIWAKPSTDGSNEGTFEIYGENGWFSPTVESQKQMQAQIDRMPKNYYQSDQPTGNIVEGSMWYKPSYDALGNVTFTMYVYHNGAWKAMTDANIEGVNAAIHQVAQTADGKNKVFSSDTQPNSANVHEGDLWFNTKNNSIYVYHGGTWTVPNASAQAQIDSAISKLNNNYYQANQPTGNIKNGDMWYKTITNSNGQVSYELYVYQNGNWVPYNVDAINGLEQKINQVAQTADGKNAVFASGSAPSNPVQGDIWIDTSDNNAIKVYINGSWQTTESQNQNVQDQVNNALNGIPKVYYQSTQPTGTINEGSTWYKTGANNTYTMYTYKNGQWVGLLDDNIDTAIDNTMNSLQQAGANLVVNSDFSQGDYGWDLPSDGSAKVSDDLFKGHKYVTISKSNQSDTPYFWISQHNEFKVTPGEKLSYSAWIKHTGLNPNGALININWYADATSRRNGWYSTYANSTNDSDWEFYKVEDITVPSNAQYARFAFTLPANGTVSYALPMLVHGSTVPSWAPSPADSVQISQSYNGVTIDDKDGITINAGNNRISLNANVGIDIYGNRQHNMKLDTNGNLIMRGNLVAGNISGVTFSGNAMQLQTGLAISGNGAITVGNDVSISASQGLVMNKGSININNNTLITNDGTLITKKLLLNNSAQILNKESGRPVITLDNNGNATFAGNLNVVNINGNNGNLNGVLNVKGGIKSNGVYLSNEGLSISNGNVILGRDVTVLAAVGAADINGAIRSITGGWINGEGGWSGSTQDCGFRIVPMRANHQIMVMLGTVPDLRRNQMAWYDSSQHFIRRDMNADFSQHKVSGSSAMYEYLYTPPSNAAYLSFSTYVGPNNVSQDVPIYIYEDGDVNLIMTNDGTLIAQSAIISGTVTSNNVNITGGHLHLMNGNNVGLDVDSNGNASFGGNLNAVNGSMNNMSLTGTLVVNGKISAANNNVQITQDGISIANGNLTLGNGNGTTFMALSDGTLTLNNASVTGQITATKLVVATKNDKNAVGINVNGNFTVDGLGEVYANNIHLKQGNNNTPTLEGVNVVGDGLKLGDTYWNAFYQNNMSRTNYTPNGLQTGYTLEGVYVQSRYRAHHGDGLQERKNMSIVTQLAYKGYVDGYSGREYDSNQDVRTGRIALLNPGQQFHLHLDGNAMPYFGKGGDRNIAFFDGSGNYISGWKGGGNDITTTSPSNARYVEISVFVGSGNVGNYFSIITGIHTNVDQINMGNLTQTRTGWVDISRFRSAIMWEGNCNMGFPIISNNYGGQDISQFGTSKDNQWVTVLTLDTTGMRDGDVMVMKYTINYDNAHSEKGTTLYMSVNGKNQYDSERYMGSTNTKYTVVGEHHYVWYFTYHSDLGSQVIFNLNANKLYYGSRVYPTEALEFIHPVNNDYNGYGNFYGSDIGGAKNTSYTGAITTMSPSGELRQTYHDRQYSLGYNSNSMAAPNKVVYRDFQLYEGFLTMQTQKLGWSPTQHGTDQDDYSALYMSGSGIAFVGNPNRFSPEKWMYRYSGSEGVKAGGSVLSFWGEVSHENLVENNFDMSLGTGITMDVFGNINAMIGSTDWRVRSFMGKPVLNISMNYGSSGFGSVLYSNIPGMSGGAYDNQDGSADAINLEEQGGHIVMGRLWLNTFGVDNYDDNSNNNVHFHLRSNNGWFFFHGETHGGPFVNDSQKELKYDIKPLSFKDSQDIIMNTDFASFKYKEQNNRTDRGHMGVVIDHDSTGYSVDPRILSEDDKGVDIMSVVAALGTLVKQQQQQISELNMQVAYLSTQLNK